LARNVGPRVSFPESIWNTWRKWWAPPGAGQSFHEQVQEAGFCRLRRLQQRGDGP
jgi:hypothetical protein